MTQPDLFTTTPQAARDLALERVEAHAADGFLEAALAAVDRVARTHQWFIVDRVWDELGTEIRTHEKRAMGAVLLMARRSALIAPTNEFQASAQVQCHANPRRVWRSLICLKKT